jgi:signal transduction histidine kinase/DNA-binding response OmpR family regulator
MEKKSKKTTINFFIKSSRIIFLAIYALLVLGASYIFLNSYNQYDYLSSSSEYSEFVNKVKNINEIKEKILIKDTELRVNEQKIIMMTSLLVLILSIFMFIRRAYILKYLEVEKQNLTLLLEDLKSYSYEDKLEKFQKMIEDKNRAEIYALMSDMIYELEDSKNSADEANKTKSLFLANMSHEIRTPLNGIVGFTKFLKSTNLDDEQDEFVNIIRKSSEDLLSIINDILDISKIENGHVELEEVFFNPMEEFENVIETYAANASKKDIDFSLWIDPSFSSLLLRSDPGKIKQVLINLISNAVKFTDKKGTIDVVIEKVSKDDTENTSVRFRVKDTGVGISENQKDKVFEAFTQADSSTSRKYGGTGLGLTISSALVNILGGSLGLDSILGEGTEFSFTINMPSKEIKRVNSTKVMKIAIYSPLDVQTKDSDRYLEDYLLSYKHLSLVRFNNLEECIDAPSSSFDVLYIHYDNINRDEFYKIFKHYKKYSNIVLVTKLNKRNEVQELTEKFAHVIYEPITFSKVEKSFNYLKNKKSLSSVKKIKTDYKNFSNLHSLVVEDNPINQKMIQHTLKNMGITSDCANNGEEGLNMYQKNSDYDVIFMDIQMPIMNGIEATHEILKYEESENISHTPIIAVTANALKGDREKFMEEGMDEYVSKPINLDMFIKALEKFFPLVNQSTKVVSNNTKDILLYKETTTEAKIISAILNKLDYSVDVVENIDELKRVMDVESYKCVLLDRVRSDSSHKSLTEYLKETNIPSLLFTDAKLNVTPSDKENYTFITDKLADYISIKEKVDKMIGLDKVS